MTRHGAASRVGKPLDALLAVMLAAVPAVTPAADPTGGSPTAAPEIHCPGPTAGNLASYLAYSAEVLNGRAAAHLDDHLSPRFHWHDAPPGTPDGIEPVRLLLRDLRRAFPDRRVETRFVLCADDLVLVQQLLTGTNTGPLLGYPPTGKSHRALHTEIYRIVDGRITEQWGEGVIPLLLLQSGWTLAWPGDAGRASRGPAAGAAAAAVTP